ncbi:hypothetical protein LA080_001591 [Diaporthe eres]|nr:hypothetical protein LA080_001591 [Diaporthe eres]
MSEKPVFLLAHGAWHPSRLYEPLKEALAKLGYTLAVPALPTMGINAKEITWDADVEALLQTAEPLFAQGKKVVLIGHSQADLMQNMLPPWQEHITESGCIPVDFSVPDITIPKTYIVCEGDQAFPTAAQHHWINTLGLREVSVSGGHTAFASVPDELAGVLAGQVE